MNRSDIRALIAQGRLSEAIEAMQQLAAGTRHENEVALLSSRLRSIEQDNRRGLLSAGELDRSRNQITHALLELLNELPEGATVTGSMDAEPVKQKKSRGLTRSGTIALAATIAAILGGIAEFSGYSLRDIFGGKPAADTNGLTVFITGKNGQSTQSLRQQGYVVLDVNGERKKELIDDKGQASFKNLHVGDQIRHLNVEFSEPFQSTRPDSVYTLDASGQIYLEVALQHLGRVFGTVLTGDQPLAGVIVLVDNTFADTTDVTGSYSIEVPENKQRPDPEVKFFKEGYRMDIKKGYPQTNQALNLVMQKLPVKKR